MTHTIDFGAGARARLNQAIARTLRKDRPERSTLKPIYRLGAANGRPDNATKRHRWLPDATNSLPASTFPQAPAKRAEDGGPD